MTRAARDVLRGAQLKIKRADKHIREAEAAIGIIEGPQNHRTVAHFNARTRKHTVKASFVAAPFEDLVCATGDAIHNLRSALDHLAWQVAMKHGCGALPAGVKVETVDFPIKKNLSSYNAMVAKGTIEKIGGVAWARFVDALRPYNGGNDLLFALSLADNVDKHREIIRIGVFPTRVALRKIVGSRVAFRPEVFYPLEEDPVIGVYWTTRPELKADMELAVSVAFTEISGLYDKPIPNALSELAQLVDGIVEKGRALL